MAKYEHIPSSKSQDCVDFIRRAYERMTGEPLQGEQLPLLEEDEQ